MSYISYTGIDVSAPGSYTTDRSMFHLRWSDSCPIVCILLQHVGLLEIHTKRRLQFYASAR